MEQLSLMDVSAVTTLLCDADGTLFPSEEPAFEASVQVTNRFLESLGVPERYEAEELRLQGNGRNFQSTLTELARRHGVAVDAEPFLTEVQGWVDQENEVVTAHLASVLKPQPEVSGPLNRLAARLELAVVTSSALVRINACLVSTGLDPLFAGASRFSAQDSLERPTSKPDPAVYQLAGRVLGVLGDGSAPPRAVAVEDAVAGATSAVAAGFPTVGMLCFVPPAELAQREQDLREVGVSALVSSWEELAALFSPAAATTEVGAR